MRIETIAYDNPFCEARGRVSDLSKKLTGAEGAGWRPSSSPTGWMKPERPSRVGVC